MYHYINEGEDEERYRTSGDNSEELGRLWTHGGGDILKSI